ncbi:MAG: nicotinate (nicotinamide) nucleotide adenylyltransferase [Clostridia bacterium]|nr:nicotinate (nicotinamide) nucleotide adenylyltransferase [Clostridia bacterium]
MKPFHKIAVFGGTFSPIHNGHLHAISALFDTVQPDMLLVIPTAVPPHKTRADNATDQDRYTMLSLALGELSNPKIAPSDIELRRGGKSYTVDTVELLREKAEEVVVFVGTDMFLTMEEWHDCERLFSMCTVAYMRREENDAPDGVLVKKAAYYREKYHANILRIPVAAKEISSTEIRLCVDNGVSPDALVPRCVAAYIREHHLYESPWLPEIERLRALVREEVGQFRARHVLSVEREAAAMAIRLIPEKMEIVRKAALLHDITKEKPEEWQVDCLRRAGETLSPDLLASPKVLHAYTAAVQIPLVYPQHAQPEVLSAVRNHTTGSPDMSLLDCIVFLADFIEPTRTYADCKRVRAYFWDNLPLANSAAEKEKLLYRAVLYALDLTIAHLQKENRPVAKISRATREAFQKRVEEMN